MANLYLDSSNSSRVRGLTDYRGVIDDTADVTVELRDSSDVLVVGESWPKTMPLFSAGGNYEVFFDPAIEIVAGETYKETILAISSVDPTKQTKFVNYRTATENTGC